ncbi:hypothetical protein [Flammeovirga sp. OC4]|uniref:hypothetical protein n=1 Tax=Flammeovirga sp. OC4 TaxID=1382345 RepID=UPI0005C6EFE1|nr:hypothetical protein [Flammeovirga sp. OC4]
MNRLNLWVVIMPLLFFFSCAQEKEDDNITIKISTLEPIIKENGDVLLIGDNHETITTHPKFYSFLVQTNDQYSVYIADSIADNLFFFKWKSFNPIHYFEYRAKFESQKGETLGDTYYFNINDLPQMEFEMEALPDSINVRDTIKIQAKNVYDREIEAYWRSQNNLEWKKALETYFDSTDVLHIVLSKWDYLNDHSSKYFKIERTNFPDSTTVYLPNEIHYKYAKVTGTDKRSACYGDTVTVFGHYFNDSMSIINEKYPTVFDVTPNSFKFKIRQSDFTEIKPRLKVDDLYELDIPSIKIKTPPIDSVVVNNEVPFTITIFSEYLREYNPRYSLFLNEHQISLFDVIKTPNSITIELPEKPFPNRKIDVTIMNDLYSEVIAKDIYINSEFNYENSNPVSLSKRYASFLKDGKVFFNSGWNIYQFDDKEKSIKTEKVNNTSTVSDQQLVSYHNQRLYKYTEGRIDYFNFNLDEWQDFISFDFDETSTFKSFFVTDDYLFLGDGKTNGDNSVINYSNDFYIYDFNDKTWSKHTTTPQEEDFDVIKTFVVEGKAYILGYKTKLNGYEAAVKIIDLTTLEVSWVESHFGVYPNYIVDNAFLDNDRILFQYERNDKFYVSYFDLNTQTFHSLYDFDAIRLSPYGTRNITIFSYGESYFHPTQYGRLSSKLK